MVIAKIDVGAACSQLHDTREVTLVALEPQFRYKLRDVGSWSIDVVAVFGCVVSVGESLMLAIVPLIPR